MNDGTLTRQRLLRLNGAEQVEEVSRLDDGDAFGKRVHGLDGKLDMIGSFDNTFRFINITKNGTTFIEQHKIWKTGLGSAYCAFCWAGSLTCWPKKSINDPIGCLYREDDLVHDHVSDVIGPYVAHLGRAEVGECLVYCHLVRHGGGRADEWAPR